MRMTVLAPWILAFATGIAAVEAAGEDTVSGLRRTVEMPVHEALVGVIRAPGTEVATFTTDGCSGGLSSTWFVVADLFPDFSAAHMERPPWEACCITHDRVYHNAAGATEADQSFDARLAADNELRRCVVETGDERKSDIAQHYGLSEAQVQLAYGVISDAMFNAVRFGGSPCSGLPWRWGYGFPACFLRSE
ncbi:MAG: hypothetical protein AAF501_06615 [Pseudomonadota bacterium]